MEATALVATPAASVARIDGPPHNAADADPPISCEVFGAHTIAAASPADQQLGETLISQATCRAALSGVAPPSMPLLSSTQPDQLPSSASAWETLRLQQELQAALDAAAAAQRSAAAAELLVAQQQASFTLTLRREREKMQADHLVEVNKVWQEVASLTGTGNV